MFGYVLRNPEVDPTSAEDGNADVVVSWRDG